MTISKCPTLILYLVYYVIGQHSTMWLTCGNSNKTSLQSLFKLDIKSEIKILLSQSSSQSHTPQNSIVKTSHQNLNFWDSFEQTIEDNYTVSKSLYMWESPTFSCVELLIIESRTSSILPNVSFSSVVPRGSPTSLNRSSQWSCESGSPRTHFNTGRTFWMTEKQDSWRIIEHPRWVIFPGV